MGDELDRLQRMLEGIQRDFCFEAKQYTHYQKILKQHGLEQYNAPHRWRMDYAKN